MRPTCNFRPISDAARRPDVRATPVRSRRTWRLSTCAALAKRAFDGAGFVKTSHHLTNVAIKVDGAKAHVNAYVQAWHWKADNTVVVAPGTWDVELTRIDGRWRISRETLAIVGAAIVPPMGGGVQPAAK